MMKWNRFLTAAAVVGFRMVAGGVHPLPVILGIAGAAYFNWRQSPAKA